MKLDFLILCVDSVDCIFIIIITGGGEAKKSVWTPSSNTVELEERITNLLLKSDLREKRYEGFKNEGVGGITLRPLHFSIFFVSLQIHVGVTPIDSSQ